MVCCMQSPTVFILAPFVAGQVLRIADRGSKGCMQCRQSLARWFSVGLLQLQPIDWDSSSASLLEKVMAYEAVHPIQGWADLHQRLGPMRRYTSLLHQLMQCQCNASVIFIPMTMAMPVLMPMLVHMSVSEQRPRLMLMPPPMLMLMRMPMTMPKTMLMPMSMSIPLGLQCQFQSSCSLSGNAGCSISASYLRHQAMFASCGAAGLPSSVFPHLGSKPLLLYAPSPVSIMQSCNDLTHLSMKGHVSVSCTRGLYTQSQAL